MTDELKDSADLLVAAARTASREGLTKEQFIHAAKCFWDSWHEAKAFMSAPPLEVSVLKKCPRCENGFGPCMAADCAHPLVTTKEG